MKSFPKSYEAMRAYNQFVLWKAVVSKRRVGKFDKFPCNAKGEIVDAHDPQHWLDPDTAVSTANLFGDDYGVGFVFTDDDPFFFVDIDGCLEGAQWSLLSTQLCASFSGAAVEVSHSRRGLHIIGKYDGDEPDHGCKNIPLHLELYTSGRFVALTGAGIAGDAGTSHNEALATVTNQYFSNVGEVRKETDWTTTHVADSYPLKDDIKLIEKAMKSKKETAESVFGNVSSKACFKDLWERNEDNLALSYPDDVRTYDESSADAALAQHLAFWTGGNCERIESLMRKSGLVRRKWDYHKSYMQRTITGAVGRQSTWYNIGRPIELVDTSEVFVPVLREAGYQLLSPDQQIEVFKDCVYIAEINKVLTPNGSKLKSDQFNAMYGGYAFMHDLDGEKTTRKAWEAFTESQCVNFPKVDAFCFRPAVKPGAIVTEEGFRYVNTYVPVDVTVTEGDVTPFLLHLRKVLPDERDRNILLSYMAACIQYKGYKIQWAPLLQGCEGNGKTLFTRCVAYAVGKRYTHFPKASKIDSEFNGWLLDKLFIGVEDIYVADNRREIIETLKPMITGGDGLEIQFKGVDQITRDVCCNFILNSNHKDAIKTTLNDRRYCVFYTAQQESIDLVRDGMSGDYFPELYTWLNGGGYAHVAHYLDTFAIPYELNPTTHCQRAPQTTSTSEAISVSLGSVEQEINEAIDEGRIGFCGGWVSSFALDKLIDDMRKGNQVPRNKRRELMRSLGYDFHPNLKNGRVNNVIMIDGGKPRLYIKSGHIHWNLTGAAEIARHYCAAQGDISHQPVDSIVSNV